MRTINHAEREFEILGKTINQDDPDSTPIVWEFKDEILALVKKFGNSGQSGGSAPYTASAIASAVKNLCLQETMAPLTGEDWEWNDVTEMSSGSVLFQNNRNSAVFKDGKDSKAYYLDAMVFVDQNGCSFTSNCPGTVSRQYIKSFPFYPKRFYIDVISTEVAKDDWESKIKNPDQLKEVFELYDPMEGTFMEEKNG